MNVREVAKKAEYVLRLERGEDVLQTLTDFCKEKGIQSGFFRGLGAVEQAKIGYYDLGKKEYGSKTYADAMEVASMTGNIALVDGSPFIHCHCVLSGIAPGTENQAIGGHVFEAKVAVTLEVHLQAFDSAIERTLDEAIGLKLLEL